MKKLYTFLIVFALSSVTYAQCTLNTFSSVDSVLCGECFTLSAFGYMAGNVAFQEDFNSGSPQGWQFTQNVTIANNTCGVPSPDGSNFMWMGSSSTNPRDMTTNPFNFTNGGNICFEMRYAIQGDASPCEGPDEPDEGVFIRYSIDNGATWVDIQYWDPNGGNDPGLTNWNQYCVAIPAAAQTNNTMIQWHQDDVSGADYDHWGIDNVEITLNDPNSQITWLHDGYNYPQGTGGGDHPTPQCIRNTTSYVARISNLTDTCYDTITVRAFEPRVVADAGADTNACPGSCVVLNGVAKVVEHEAKTETYENAERDNIVAFFGIFDAEMNINVTGINETNVSASSIKRICITDFDISGTFTNYSLADVDIIVECPDGTTITLVPSGQLSGNQITDMCFEVGGISIGSGSAPYTDTFDLPASISSLNGCSSNGLWKMTMSGATIGFDVPTGGIGGWSITFDDPEVSVPAILSWTPTTGMSNANTANPTVCPDETTVYTLTARDSGNCVTRTSSIAVSPCTGIIPDITIPNVISPNNDGKNETFIIENMLEYPNSSLIVYNRWGKVVWDSDNYQNDFNGSNKAGYELSEGVYFYVLSNDKWLEDFNGNITVVR